MITLKSYDTFRDLTILQAVNATTMFQSLLEEKTRYLTLDKFEGENDEEILQSVKELHTRGYLKISNPDVDLDEVEGIEVESIQLCIKLRTFDDPMPDPNQGALDFKSEPRPDSGQDEFRIGYATYRGIVDKSESPEDPLTPYRLTIGRLTIFEPETGPGVDRFRSAGQWSFSSAEGAWAHFDAFKEKRLDSEDGYSDMFMVDDKLIGFTIERDASDPLSPPFTVAISSVNDDSVFEATDDQFDDDDACFRSWEAYLDRVAPAGELPDEFRVGRFSALEVFDDEGAEKPTEVPVFEFDVTIGEVAYSVEVFHGVNTRIEGTYFDQNSEKQVRTIGAKFAEVKNEELAKKFAEDWLAS